MIGRLGVLVIWAASAFASPTLAGGLLDDPDVPPLCSIFGSYWTYEPLNPAPEAEPGPTHLVFSEALAPVPLVVSDPSHSRNWRLVLSSHKDGEALHMWRLTRGSPKAIELADFQQNKVEEFGLLKPRAPEDLLWTNGKSDGENETVRLTSVIRDDCFAYDQIWPNYCNLANDGLGRPECRE